MSVLGAFRAGLPLEAAPLSLEWTCVMLRAEFFQTGDYWHTGLDDFCYGGFSVCCGICSSILGHFPLNTSMPPSHQVVTTNQRHC